MMRQGSAEWLAERDSGIGGSEIAAVCGLSDFATPYVVAARKLHLLPPEPPSEAMDWGHRLEPVVVAAYEEQTGRRTRRVNRIMRHPEHPFALASLDRVVVGEKRLLEVKTTRSRKWDDGIPADAECQVQWYLGITGYPTADIAVLRSGSELSILPVTADPDYFADLLTIAERFWTNLQAGILPDPTAEEESAALRAKYPRDNGVLLPPDQTFASLAHDLVSARQRKREAEEYEATVSTAIRKLLGEAAGVEGLFTYRKNADSVRVNWPAVATAYRRIAEQLGAAPDELETVQSIHSETVVGPRVLRLVLKETK